MLPSRRDPLEVDPAKVEIANLAEFEHADLAHPDLVGLVVPIGRGELVAVKL